MDEVAQRVVALWNKQGGWIPGASYRELAKALGVDESELIHYVPGKGRHYPEGTKKSDDPNIPIG